MKRTQTFTLFMVLLTSVQFGHAELLLDSTKKPDQVKKVLEPLFESVVRPYIEQHAVEFGGDFPTKHTSFPNYPNSTFTWIFNGARLYSNISAFVPEIVALEDCKAPQDYPYPKSYCDWRRSGFNVCHLFMFNERSLKLENVTRLNIVRDKKMLGLPRCRNIQAMAVAKTIPDAMLITLEYSDSNEPADPRNDPPLFYSTVLLRFHDENGKLKIEQDDSCLGNPNKYKTIAAARKALASCPGYKN